MSRYPITLLVEDVKEKAKNKNKKLVELNWFSTLQNLVLIDSSMGLRIFKAKSFRIFWNPFSKSYTGTIIAL